MSGSSIQSQRQTEEYTEPTSGSSIQSYVRQQYTEPMSGGSIKSLRQTAEYTEPTSGSNIQSLCQTAVYIAYVRQQYTEPTSDSRVYKAYVR